MITKRSVLRVAGISAAALAAQVVGAVFHPVPRQPEFDASGVIGDGEVLQRWLVLGDSTTTGPGVSGPHEIWVQQLARRSAADGAIHIRSIAVGGAGARHVVADQLPIAMAYESCDVVFVSVGANDVLKGASFSTYRKSLELIARELSRRHRSVVISGVGDLSAIPRLRRPLSWIIGRRARRFDRAASEVAAAHGAAKIDHWTHTAPAFRTAEGVFSADLLHPTGAGHAIWADAVEATLRGRRQT